MIQLTIQADDAAGLLAQLQAIGIAAANEAGNPLDHVSIAALEAELNKRMAPNGLMVAFVSTTPDSDVATPDEDKPAPKRRGRPKKQKEPEPEPDSAETGAEPEPEPEVTDEDEGDTLDGLLDETGNTDDIGARFDAVAEKLKAMVSGKSPEDKMKAKLISTWFKGRFGVALLSDLKGDEQKTEFVQYCETKGVTP